MSTNEVKLRLSVDGAGQVQAGVSAAAQSLDNLAATSAKLGQTARAADVATQDLARSSAALGQNARAADAAAGSLLGSLNGIRTALAAAGIGVGVQQIAQLGNALLQAKVRADALRTALDFATGGRASSEIASLRRTTHELGLEFQSTATAYAKFAAAARDTALQGEGARKVFDAVAKASAVIGLSAEENAGALLALGQMISKGTVSAEELRGQLGERLPGAFQIAARAMGVTTAELGRLLEQGLIPAAEFLPKFADQLNRELGDAAAGAADRIAASVNRLSNAWERLKQAGGESAIGEVFQDGATNLAGLMDEAANAMARAQARGAGFFGTMAAGAGPLAALFNPLRLVGAEVGDVTVRLKQAERDLAELQAKLDKNPQAFYLSAQTAAAARLVRELREAKQAQSELSAQSGAGMDAGLGAASSAIAAIAKQGLEDQSKAAALLLQARNRALGVDAAYLKQVLELNAARERGLVTEAEYAEAVQGLTERTYRATRAVKEQADAYTDARQAAAAWADAVRDGQQMQAEAEAETLGLSKAQERLIQYLRSPEYARHSDQMRQIVVSTLAAANASQQHAKAQRDGATAAAEAARIGQRLIADLERRAELAAGQVQALEDEARAIEIVESAQVSLAQATAMVAIERLREQQVGAMGNEAAVLAIQREIDARQRLIELIRSKDTREANAKAAADHAREWERISDQVGQSLSDALMQGGKSAAEYLKGLFRSLVLRPIIQAAVQPWANVAMQVIGAGAYGGGTAGNMVNAASNAASLYNAYQGGGMTGAALAAGNYGSVYSGAAYGTGFGSQQSAMLAAQESGMVSSAGASSMGAMAGYAAAVIAAWMASSDAYKKGFSNDRLTGAFRYSPESTFTDLLKLGGMSDKSANIWGGGAVYASLFGRAAPRVTESGIDGWLGAGDFTGTAYADILEKGGLFRSDRRSTETAALSDDLSRFMDDAAKAMFTEAAKFGDALGLPAEQLASVQTKLRVALTADAEKNQQAISEALGKYGDALVESFADEVAPLVQYGETTAQTIARVGQSILSVNSVLDALGMQALQLSVDGGKAAVALADVFGGFDGLQQSAGQFLQGFYSSAERESLLRDQLTAEFGQYGQALPATRDAFRDLVLAQDLTTASGREAFRALMGVSEAFAQVTRSADDIAAERAGLAKQLLQLQGDTDALRTLERDALDESNRALFDHIQGLQAQQSAAQAAADAAADAAAAWGALAGGMAGGVQSAYSAVASTISAERQRVESEAQQQAQALERQAERIRQAWGGLIDGIGSAVDTLAGQSAGDGGRGRAMQTLRAAAADLARGQAVDIEGVRAAAGEVSNLGTDAFGSRLDYQRAIAGTQTLLRDVQGAARRQMTSELGQVAAEQVAIEQRLQDQLKVLDDQLAEARSAAETLVSIDDGVQTVAEAIAALGDAIGAMSLANGGPGPTGRWLRNGDSELWASAAGALGARERGNSDPAGLMIRGKASTFSASEARAWVNDRLNAGAPADIVARALAEGIDSAALDALMEWPQGTALAEALRRGLPAFAAGSAYVPRTGVALVHEGERILPADDNAALMRIMRGDGQGGDMAAELRALRAEVERLRAETSAGQAAIASHTNKAARLLDDAIYGGASIATRAEA